MYRKLTIVVIALILITGCTRITDNLDDVVNAVMKNDSIHGITSLSAPCRDIKYTPYTQHIVQSANSKKSNRKKDG